MAVFQKHADFNLLEHASQWKAPLRPWNKPGKIGQTTRVAGTGTHGSRTCGKTAGPHSSTPYVASGAARLPDLWAKQVSSVISGCPLSRGSIKLRTRELSVFTWWNRVQIKGRRITSLHISYGIGTMNNICRLVLLAMLAAGLGLSPLTRAEPLAVLWYTYADAASEYRLKVSHLSSLAHTLPQNDGVRWNLTYWEAANPPPDLAAFDVLVIQSGEAFLTGVPGEPNATPDYTGILKNKTEIEAARGDRTFITSSDADFHAIRGDTGNMTDDPAGANGGGKCVPALTSPHCWDGALGHAANAINWAGSGSRLGIVSFLDGEHPGSFWWAHEDSFLRNELSGHVDYDGSEQNPIINAQQATHPLNSGLTSRGLSNWNNSFHATFLPVEGYTPIIDSSLRPGSAVAIAQSRQLPSPHLNADPWSAPWWWLFSP